MTCTASNHAGIVTPATGAEFRHWRPAGLHAAQSASVTWGQRMQESATGIHRLYGQQVTWGNGVDPASDTTHIPTSMWMQLRLRVHAVLCGLEGEPQFQPAVDAGFGGGVGVLDDVADVAEGLDDLLDALFGERRAAGLAGERGADGAFEPVRGEDGALEPHGVRAGQRDAGLSAGPGEARVANDGSELQLRNPGHDLQLPYLGHLAPTSQPLAELRGQRAALA